MSSTIYENVLRTNSCCAGNYKAVIDQVPTDNFQVQPNTQLSNSCPSFSSSGKVRNLTFLSWVFTVLDFYLIINLYPSELKIIRVTNRQCFYICTFRPNHSIFTIKIRREWTWLSSLGLKLLCRHTSTMILDQFLRKHVVDNEHILVSDWRPWNYQLISTNCSIHSAGNIK